MMTYIPSARTKNTFYMDKTDIIKRYNEIMPMGNFKSSYYRPITIHSFNCMLLHADPEFNMNGRFVTNKMIMTYIKYSLERASKKGCSRGVGGRNYYFARAYTLARILMEAGICKREDFPKIPKELNGEPFSDTNRYDRLFTSGNNNLASSRRTEYKRSSCFRNNSRKKEDIDETRYMIRAEIRMVRDNIESRAKQNQEDLDRLEALYERLDKKYDIIQKIQRIKERAVEKACTSYKSTY